MDYGELYYCWERKVIEGIREVGENSQVLTNLVSENFRISKIDYSDLSQIFTHYENLIKLAERIENFGREFPKDSRYKTYSLKLGNQIETLRKSLMGMVQSEINPANTPRKKVND